MRPSLTFEQRRELRARVSQARREKLAADLERRRQAALGKLASVAGDYRMRPARV